MEFKTHWIFDDFYPHAPRMRQDIDDHFTESASGKLPFTRRSIWNYWFIPTLYMYLRAEPWVLFSQELFDGFMLHLRQFAARQFGLIINTSPFISMYVDGCGQNIHNDFGNGRLAYVFSLTNWAERHFQGGETFIYKTGHQANEQVFRSTGGWGWYDYAEPLFNRLALFDDRLPHAVNFIQGTMNPLDARFVMHGHMEESDIVPFAEGGLAEISTEAAFYQAKTALSGMFRAHGLDGFVTVESIVEPSGRAERNEITCMQLLPSGSESKKVEVAMADAQTILSHIIWPEAAGSSRLVYAVSSSPLR